MESAGAANLLMTFITFAFVIAIFLLVAIPITIRKGKSVVLTIVLAIIPIVGFMYIYWVLSLTDKKVLERLEAIEKKLSEEKSS